MRSGGELERPPLPPGFDDSRARERRAEPGRWRFDEAARAGVWRAIAKRRDIRRFRPDPVSDELLDPPARGGAQAPSVGLMQPWRFIVVRDETTKAAMQAIASRERLVQADHLDERARPVPRPEARGDPRGAAQHLRLLRPRAAARGARPAHDPDTDLYSTCLAIENLWLAARPRASAIGWVSFYEEDEVRRPARDSGARGAGRVAVRRLSRRAPERPGLEAAGWGMRHPLGRARLQRTLGAGDRPEPAPAGPNRLRPSRRDAARRSALWPGGARLRTGVGPGDRAAAVRVRDASDELVKPAGSLGGLETLLERWAAATGDRRRHSRPRDPRRRRRPRGRPRTASASTRRVSAPRSPPRRPVARPRSACSPARSARSCSSPTSACGAARSRRRPARSASPTGAPTSPRGRRSPTSSCRRR